MSTIYNEIAQLRWPRYTLAGTGSVAVVLECSGKVLLCTTPLEANALVAEQCGPLCNHGDKFHTWHRVHQLEQPRPEHVRTFRRINQDEDE